MVKPAAESSRMGNSIGIPLARRGKAARGGRCGRSKKGQVCAGLNAGQSNGAEGRRGRDQWRTAVSATSGISRKRQSGSTRMPCISHTLSDFGFRIKALVSEILFGKLN
jgi:hypothetical protein